MKHGKGTSMTPQQIEALKLALEALEGFYEYGYDRQECFEHITALKEALAEHAMQEVQRLGQEIEQEPVAIKCMKEWIEYLKRKSDFGQHMKIPSEMSAGTCWELALELEQFINTTPPQRTWVELSDEQIEDCYKQGGIGRAIQLFKEENT
jgi:hypothetical protein